MLDVVGVSGYNDSCHKLLGIVQICHLWRQETVNLKIVFFFVKKNAQGTSKTDIEVPHMNYRFCCKPKLKKRIQLYSFKKFREKNIVGIQLNSLPSDPQQLTKGTYLPSLRTS